MKGLVLEGGGAKGSFQIGAWKALRELGIEFTGIAGTSVGALNGAMIVQDDFEKAYETWYNISPQKILNVDDNIVSKIKEGEIYPETFLHLLKIIKEVFFDKGFDITPLKQLLKENISEEAIRNSNKDFGIVTVSLTDLKPEELYIEDIPHGKLIDYLIASANLPLFKMEKIDGKLFLDGGFFDNIPIKLLVNKGYKDIIVVRLYGIGRTRKINKKGLNILTITPSEDLGHTLDFSCDRARRNLNLGYFDTLKILKKYSGNHYYIDVKQPEDYFLHLFLNMDQKTVNKLAQIFGLSEKIPYRRLLFEKIIPSIANILGLDLKASYKDIYIAILEKIAVNSNIEKFKIYTFEEFINCIIANFKPKRLNKSNHLLKISLKNDAQIEKLSRIFVNEIKNRQN